MPSFPFENFDDPQLHLHASALRRLARSLGRHYEVAEEPSQEAWLAALRLPGAARPSLKPNR